MRSVSTEYLGQDEGYADEEASPCSRLHSTSNGRRSRIDIDDEWDVSLSHSTT